MNPRGKALISSIDKRVGTMTKKLGTTQKRGHFGRKVSRKEMPNLIKKLGE